jgi:hypothetical protein
MGDEQHLVFECPHLHFIRDKVAGLFRVQSMVQFFWQNNLVNVSKCACLPVRLGADSDDRSQTSISPWWLEKTRASGALQHVKNAAILSQVGQAIYEIIQALNVIIQHKLMRMSFS